MGKPRLGRVVAPSWPGSTIQGASPTPNICIACALFWVSTLVRCSFLSMITVVHLGDRPNYIVFEVHKKIIDWPHNTGLVGSKFRCSLFGRWNLFHHLRIYSFNLRFQHQENNSSDALILSVSVFVWGLVFLFYLTPTLAFSHIFWTSSLVVIYYGFYSLLAMVYRCFKTIY